MYRNRTTFYISTFYKTESRLQKKKIQKASMVKKKKRQGFKCSDRMKKQRKDRGKVKKKKKSTNDKELFLPIQYYMRAV